MCLSEQLGYSIKMFIKAVGWLARAGKKILMLLAPSEEEAKKKGWWKFW
jgi:hypothetical protein